MGKDLAFNFNLSSIEINTFPHVLFLSPGLVRGAPPLPPVGGK